MGFKRLLQVRLDEQFDRKLEFVKQKRGIFSNTAMVRLLLHEEAQRLGGEN